MAKGLFKGNNNLLLGGVVRLVLFAFYVFKRKEGFQGNPTVPVGPPTTFPATNTMSETNALSPPMPSMNTENVPMPSMPSMPSTSSMPSAQTSQSATTVAVVRAKLDELKTLVDSM